MSLSIRQAATDDRDRIVLFNQAMAKETEGRKLDRGTLTRGVEAMLADPARGRYFVAEEVEGASGEPKIVGQLAVTTEWSDWRNGDIWWIQSVYVARSHRRRGIYGQLHRHVRALAGEAGVIGLRLYVERDNEAARSTYQALGMRPSSYVMYEELWPAS
ncbi:MAG: GNAT family N-acetyltransferase [Gemmatimonadota bacterium]